MKRKTYEPAISKAEGQRLNAEVSRFENETSYCPLYLAWRIVDEARHYFRTEIPESYARKLARRAEAVFAHHPFWARKVRFRRSQTAATGREFILMSMRHWLAGVLARENPVLFRQLPDGFKVGRPLPLSATRKNPPLIWLRPAPASYSQKAEADKQKAEMPDATPSNYLRLRSVP